jgi:hypothetical protein
MTREALPARAARYVSRSVTDAVMTVGRGGEEGQGECIEPSSQGLGAYGAEVIDGLRIRPQTRARYVKNWRNHIEPYPIAAVPLAQLAGWTSTASWSPWRGR